MSGKVQQILSEALTLTPAERQDLIEALGREYLKGRSGPSVEIVTAIRGKYAYVPTSSEDFMKRKQDDLSLED